MNDSTKQSIEAAKVEPLGLVEETNILEIKGRRYAKVFENEIIIQMRDVKTGEHKIFVKKSADLKPSENRQIQEVPFIL